MFNIINKVIKTISFLLYSCVYTVICEIDHLALNMNVSKTRKKTCNMFIQNIKA